MKCLVFVHLDSIEPFLFVNSSTTNHKQNMIRYGKPATYALGVYTIGLVKHSSTNYSVIVGENVTEKNSKSSIHLNRSFKQSDTTQLPQLRTKVGYETHTVLLTRRLTIVDFPAFAKPITSALQTWEYRHTEVNCCPNDVCGTRLLLCVTGSQHIQV